MTKHFIPANQVDDYIHVPDDRPMPGQNFGFVVSRGTEKPDIGHVESLFVSSSGEVKGKLSHL